MLRKSLLIAVLGAIVLPASATAATMSHTWVSGVGDDANPCTRTAPCKTFQGAYPQTTAGGEISVLDPGSFGPLTITEAITIDGNGENGLVTPTTGPAFTIAAGAADHVVIKDINFVGDGAAQDAIRINSAASLDLQDSDIYGFAHSAIDDQSTAAVSVSGTSIHDNAGDGVVLAPPGGGAGRVSLGNDTINGNACGVVATGFGMPTAPSFPTNCGVNTSGTAAGTAQITTLNSSVVGNSFAGVFANGSPSTDYIQGDTISGNGPGLQELAGGQIVWIGENWVFDNSPNGMPTSTVNAGQGPPGSQGAQGANGKVELVTCKKVTKKVKKHGKTRKKKVEKCKTKTVSGNVKFKLRGRIKHATLSRGGTVYAVGTLVSGSGGSSEAILSPERELRAGSYVLTVSENGRVVGRRTVSVS